MNFSFKYYILALGVLSLDTANAQMCTKDHDILSHNIEFGMKVTCMPQDPDTYLGLTLDSDAGPYAGLFVGAWCVDLDRYVSCGNSYKVDSYSSYDDDIPSSAIDRPENLDLLNWLINEHPTGSNINIPDCHSGVLGWEEYQQAVWRIIDHREHDLGGKNCISDYLVEQAQSMGEGYEFDCNDPNLDNIKIGVLMIADTDDGTITNQVLFAEIPLGAVSGVCDCATSVPAIAGDPHLVTWSNEKYDFHGICDLVLLQNPGFQNGFGMAIHVRTKQIKQFSYVSSAALKIGGGILEVVGDIHDNVFWINGQRNKNVDNGIVGVISGYPISYQKVNSKQHEFTVNIGHGESIVMTTFKTFVRVSIHGATEESFGTSLGLLGSYGSGKRIARDNSTVMEDTDAFGQEWQVLPLDDMLFHNVEGPQWPAKCQMPGASNVRRRLFESNISREEAEIVCTRGNPSDFDMCVFDVMATGDKDVAGAY